MAALLRQAGFDAESVWDENLEGATDPTISERVREEKRILITLDRAFSDIRAYPPGAHPGIIVLRLMRQDLPNTLAVVRRLILALAQRDPSGELWTVEERRIRFRRG